MPDLFKKFANAAKEISSEKTATWECVYGAYVEHLSDIHTDDLPEEIKIFYESVKIRLTSIVPPGNISDAEATWIAKDIVYIADMMGIHNRP